MLHARVVKVLDMQIMVIDGVDLAVALGVKSISDKQKANFKRWFDTHTDVSQSGGQYFNERYVTLLLAKTIVKKYLGKQAFKENAEKVNKELDDISNRPADTFTELETVGVYPVPPISEGQPSDNYIITYNGKKYWTAFGLGMVCNLVDHEWDKDLRSGVSNVLAEFMVKKCGYGSSEIMRTHKGISAYPLEVWAKWIDMRLKRGDKIEGIFQRLLYGLYSIRHFLTDTDGKSLISWDIYEKTMIAKSIDAHKINDAPIDRVKRRLTEWSSKDGVLNRQPPELDLDQLEFDLYEIVSLINNLRIRIRGIKNRLKCTTSPD